VTQEALTEASYPSTPSSPASQRLAVVRALVIEVFLLGVMFGVYELGRHLADAEAGEAITHARHVWHLERLLDFPSETAIQSWVLGQVDVARLANLYYVGVHFPATFAILVWLFVRHRGEYLRVRTELIISTAIALLIHINYPLAPPRLVPQFGIVDTMVTVGPSAYPQSTDSGFANQFAAMPSLHVGWAVLMAIAVIRVYRTRWRWAALLYPAATWTVVVVTGNHYLIDGVVGTAIVLVAVVACGFVPRWRVAAHPAPAAGAASDSSTLTAGGVPGQLAGRPGSADGELVGSGRRGGLDIQVSGFNRPGPRQSTGDELQDARSH
jgi:PAP2 superfamily